jgi:two-component system chemotaxis response regulator CheB
MPVVMVSTLTAKGTDTTIAALALGAVDCVVKPSAENPNSFDQLPAKIKVAAKVKRRAPLVQAVVQTPQVSSSYSPDGKIVGIGSSTGGVEALISVLTAFPANCPPTLITQHMPPVFTRNLAARLDKMCAPRVVEATIGAPLTPGTVYIAPGGDLHLEIAGRTTFACALKPGGLINGHCPSVDRLFSSMARSLGPRAIGVLLTGMGRDGAQGLLEIHQAGGRTIAQDEASSIVYGMPKAALDLGAVDIQYSIGRIGHAIIEATSGRT